jgi:hypothetical protein
MFLHLKPPLRDPHRSYRTVKTSLWLWLEPADKYATEIILGLASADLVSIHLWVHLHYYVHLGEVC